MIKRAFLPVLVLSLGLALLFWTMRSPFWQSLRQVGGIMRLVHQEYVHADEVGYDRLAEAAIEGMVHSLDPYSRYMPAADYTRFEELTQQRYVGIGVEIERLDRRVTVVTVFPGGPAEGADLRPGDQIIEVDGRDLRDASVVEVSEALRGPAGGEATVEVYRPRSDERLRLELTRRPIDLASVAAVELWENRMGYLRITQFGERTDEEFREALGRLESQGMEGLIVDLRGNPGGLLRTAKEVASEFFERGELIVFTQGRDASQREDFRSRTPARPVSYPLVVLINELSASGAEIVAGAWQDTGKALVVGETSYGKGSVQSVYAFHNGGGLRQTTALYYLPSGRSINESGVVPDRVVSMDEEAELRLRLQQRHRDYLSPEEFERIFERTPDQVDEQLEAAKSVLGELMAERRPHKV